MNLQGWDINFWTTLGRGAVGGRPIRPCFSMKCSVRPLPMRVDLGSVTQMFKVSCLDWLQTGLFVDFPTVA